MPPYLLSPNLMTEPMEGFSKYVNQNTLCPFYQNLHKGWKEFKSNEIQCWKEFKYQVDVNLDSKTRPNVSDYLLGHLQVNPNVWKVLSIKFITSRSSLFLARRSKVDPAPTTLPRCGKWLYKLRIIDKQVRIIPSSTAMARPKPRLAPAKFSIVYEQFNLTIRTVSTPAR